MHSYYVQHRPSLAYSFIQLGELECHGENESVKTAAKGIRAMQALSIVSPAFYISALYRAPGHYYARCEKNKSLLFYELMNSFWVLVQSGPYIFVDIR